jgi:osmotically inducible protein OsmC
MATRTGSAVWEGTLKEGKGNLKVGSGAYEGQYSFASRFENGTGTNPEELIGAAEAACFSMAMSVGLEKAGHPPTKINTTAKVKLEKVGEAFRITTIELETEADVPGIDDAKFQEIAEQTKKNCPVSVALSGTQINLKARLSGH